MTSRCIKMQLLRFGEREKPRIPSNHSLSVQALLIKVKNEVFIDEEIRMEREECMEMKKGKNAMQKGQSITSPILAIRIECDLMGKRPFGRENIA